MYSFPDPFIYLFEDKSKGVNSILVKENNISKNAEIRGLSEKEAELSRERYGDNRLAKAKKIGFWRRFISNLGDPVIKILLGALVLNLLFMFRHTDWFETAGIAISVFLATLISTLSEYGSQNAFQRLEEAAGRIKCRVLRENEVKELEIEEIVVGDIILVGAGEQIPADGHLLDGELSCDQSAMTGESREAYKKPLQRDEKADTSPSSSSYCLRGCTVLSGSGIIRAEKVGKESFLGGISKEIQEETRESPLKLRLSRLARQISVVGYIAALLVALVYLFNIFIIDSAFDAQVIKYKLLSFEYLFYHLFHAFTLGLTVIVVAVPEGLPMMIAVVLSSNIKKMVKDNVLVRKPVGLEAGGSMNILFSDKTGTLTEGKLSIGQVILGDKSEYDMKELSKKPIYSELLLSAFANTTSSIGVDSEEKRSALGGNSTDRAILGGAFENMRGQLPEFYPLGKLPFDSEKKFSAALIREKGRTKMLVKGAPEKLLGFANEYLDSFGERRPLNKKEIESICRSLTRQGKRLLVLALSSEQSIKRIERGEFGKLTLIALVTLEDKIRRSAPSSVKKLRGAGIQLVMITGDNRETAEFIAKKCGILDKNIDLLLTSDELARLSDAQLKELLPRIGVVARALPQDKSRLVRISQELDLVVGMTGDGINDAPALKRADVGFAMGSGTQVAKEAGDIIILDNDLSSIVKAVLYGRNIFKSIRKFITLQLTMNFCAVGVSMICPFLGFDAPVTVVQMLWINIIMDTLGGLAFAGEPALEACMEEKPKRRDEPILNGYMVYSIIFGGGFTIALCIAFLRLPEISSCFRWSGDNIYLLTAFFALFIFASVFNCFNARTDRLSLFANITKNPAFIIIMAAVLLIQIVFIYLGGAVLRTAPLTAYELFVTSLLALTVFPADILRKLIWRMTAGKKGY